MKKNKWIFIVAGLVSLGAISYFIFRKKADSKKLKGDSGDDAKPSDTKPSDTSENKPNESKPSENINYSARGVKHIKKRIEDLTKLLSDIENRGNDVLWYKPENREMGTSIKNTMWLTSYRNIKSLRGGVQNDKELNKETIDYALGLLNDFENFNKKIFNPEKYNDKQKWVIDALKKINDPPNYFYDR